MMKISGMNGTSPQAGQMGMMQGADAQTKSIKDQIAKAQKQLQELSSDEKLSAEEKMKKRQELQKQITDLNNQLRQHQIELRREKQQAKDSSIEELTGGTKQTGRYDSKGAGLSKGSMKAMISADAALEQARVQEQTATGLEGRAGVLKAEIKQDAGRGGGVEAKKEELAEVEQLAENATSSQIDTLGKANRELKEAEEEEKSTSVSKTKQTDKEQPKTKQTEKEQAETNQTETKQVKTEGTKTEQNKTSDTDSENLSIGTESGSRIDYSI